MSTRTGCEKEEGARRGRGGLGVLSAWAVLGLRWVDLLWFLLWEADPSLHLPVLRWGEKKILRGI
jgi:hypothetical protein